MEIKYLKSKVVAFAIIIVLLALPGCTVVNSETTTSSNISGSNSSSSIPETRSLNILVTSRMLKNIVTYYTGDYHTVEAMVNSDKTLKTFKPYFSFYKDKNYDTFLYHGADYEPFIEGFLSDVDRNTIDVVNLSRGIDILRFKENNLDKENPYFLTNSTNYKIILSSIKNNLQELDMARRKEYEAKFDQISVKIDELQKKIKTFSEANKNMAFICDSELAQYICQEYREDCINIIKYTNERVAGQTMTSDTSKAQDSGNLNLFLYTDDISLNKYADEISKFNLSPVKIKLYDYDMSVMDVLETNYQGITQAALKIGGIIPN